MDNAFWATPNRKTVKTVNMTISRESSKQSGREKDIIKKSIFCAKNFFGQIDWKFEAERPVIFR